MNYAGSNLTAILAALTAAMCADGGPAIGNQIGTDADAQHTSANAVIWIPRPNQPAPERTDEQPEDPTTGRPLGKVIARKRLLVDAVIYGKDFEAAQVLEDRVLAGLYTAFSENGADPFSAAPGGLEGGGAREGGGFSVVLPVAFLVPVYVETYRAGTGAPSSTSGVVKSPQGQNPEPITS